MAALTSTSLAVLYKVARVLDPVAASGAFERVGGDEQDFELLASRYRMLEHYGGVEELDVELAVRFVLHFGSRTQAAPAAFEALLHEEGVDGLVAPFWMLSRPIKGGLQRRMPAIPLAPRFSEVWYDAYRGLAEHVEWLDSTTPDDHLEIWKTSVPWRILAIAERLFQEVEGNDETSAGGCLLTLRGRLSRTASGTEQRWLSLLDGTVASRRHAVSHLVENQGATFYNTNDAWNPTEIKQATAAIGLAVLMYASQELRTDRSDEDLVLEALDRTSWLDGLDALP